ncbi:MAG: hypothetical protein Q7K42_01335 [Candidatus Diapherotrites archaeon]|nr:hypothetical protein [Candidatus Diapherotrites archaeon]
MKKILLVLMVVLILANFGNVFALNIIAPNEVPEQFSWNFSVQLDSADTFDETKIFLDDKPVVSAYANGIVQINPLNGTFVDKAFSFDHDAKSTAGLVVYINYSGMAEGKHTLKAVSLKAEEKVSETSRDVIFFKPVNSGFEEQITTNLDSLKTKISDYEKNISVLEAQIKKLNLDEKTAYGLQEQLNNMNSELLKLRNENKQLKASIALIGIGTDTSVPKTAEKTTAVQANQGFNPIAGLSSLFGAAQSKEVNETFSFDKLVLPTLALLVIVCSFFGLVFMDKIVGIVPKRMRNSFGEDSLSQSLKKKKWGIENSNLVPLKKTNEAKIQMGDLIMKKEDFGPNAREFERD